MTDSFDFYGPEDAYPLSDDGIAFFRARTLGELLGDATRFISDHLRPIAASFLAIGGPCVLLVVVASLWIWTRIDSGESLGLIVVFVLVFGIASLFITGAMFAVLRVYFYQGPASLTLPVLWAETRAVFWPLFRVAFVTNLLSGLLNLTELIPVLGPFISFGLSMVTLPVFTLAVVARMLDQGSTSEALDRVTTLATEEPRAAFGYGLLIALVTFVAGMLGLFLPMMGGGFAIDILGIVGVTAGTSALVGIGVLFLTVGQAVLMFFFTAYALLYGHLVDRVEGVSLGARVAALEDETAPLDDTPAW
ncbi:MAG: hypothetical protein AAGG50_06045 [Bacteroidota bacterium]